MLRSLGAPSASWRWRRATFTLRIEDKQMKESTSLYQRVGRALLSVIAEQSAKPPYEGAYLTGAIILSRTPDLTVFVVDRAGLREMGLAEADIAKIMESAAIAA